MDEVKIKKELAEELLDKLAEAEYGLELEYGSSDVKDKQDFIDKGYLPECYYKLKEKLEEQC